MIEAAKEDFASPEDFVHKKRFFHEYVWVVQRTVRLTGIIGSLMETQCHLSFKRIKT